MELVWQRSFPPHRASGSMAAQAGKKGPRRPVLGSERLRGAGDLGGFCVVPAPLRGSLVSELSPPRRLGGCGGRGRGLARSGGLAERVGFSRAEVPERGNAGEHLFLWPWRLQVPKLKLCGS